MSSRETDRDRERQQSLAALRHWEGSIDVHVDVLGEARRRAATLPVPSAPSPVVDDPNDLAGRLSRLEAERSHQAAVDAQRAGPILSMLEYAVQTEAENILRRAAQTRARAARLQADAERLLARAGFRRRRDVAEYDADPNVVAAFWTQVRDNAAALVSVTARLERVMAEYADECRTARDAAGKPYTPPKPRELVALETERDTLVAALGQQGWTR
jgi:hypothetical protein